MNLPILNLCRVELGFSRAIPILYMYKLNMGVVKSPLCSENRMVTEVFYFEDTYNSDINRGTCTIHTV